MGLRLSNRLALFGKGGTSACGMIERTRPVRRIEKQAGAQQIHNGEIGGVS